jgi:hypothetical protein
MRCARSGGLDEFRLAKMAAGFLRPDHFAQKLADRFVRGPAAQESAQVVLGHAEKAGADYYFRCRRKAMAVPAKGIGTLIWAAH